MIFSKVPITHSRIGFGSAISRALHRRKAKLISQLECHSPFSSGSVPQRYELTLGAAGCCYRTLLSFLNAFDPDFRDCRRLTLEPSGSPLERQLSEQLTYYGSDKATSHSYHHLYSRALDNPERIGSFLEIGIGTNNPGIVSNMTGLVIRAHLCAPGRTSCQKQKLLAPTSTLKYSSQRGGFAACL